MVKTVDNFSVATFVFPASPCWPLPVKRGTENTGIVNQHSTLRIETISRPVTAVSLSVARGCGGLTTIRNSTALAHLYNPQKCFLLGLGTGSIFLTKSPSTFTSSPHGIPAAQRARGHSAGDHGCNNRARACSRWSTQMIYTATTLLNVLESMHINLWARDAL